MLRKFIYACAAFMIVFSCSDASMDDKSNVSDLIVKTGNHLWLVLSQ